MFEHQKFRRISTTISSRVIDIATTAVAASICLLLVTLTEFSVANSIGFVGATSVKMDFLPIGHGRVDPILNNECVSDHVHSFYGPQGGVDPRFPRADTGKSLYETLVESDVSTNTGNVIENKSLYWHPTVYKYDRNTDTYTRDVMAQTSAYYIWETGKATAFPNGFRMIGGFDVDKSFAIAECVNEQPCDDEEDDCESDNTFFPTSKCDELEVSMRMPNCWDGVTIDSPETQQQGHVAYSDDSEFDSKCPDSHPVQVPQIQLFFRIMPYDGGWHTFSDGSSVFHADYVSGWNSTFLQQVLNECDNEGAAAMPNFFCEQHLTFRDGPKCTDEEKCDFGDPNLLKKLKSIQPKTPLDVTGTIVAEETKTVQGLLPRGTCQGNLVDLDNSNNDNPTPVPPTPPPTTKPPTLAPVTPNDSDDEECVDDSEFRYKKNEKYDCDWVGKKVDKRCGKIWKGIPLEEHCPETCQLETVCGYGSTDSNDEEDENENDDCENEPDKVGSFKYKGKQRTCEWVGEKLNKNCKKAKLRNKCPETCDANGCIDD